MKTSLQQSPSPAFAVHILRVSFRRWRQYYTTAYVQLNDTTSASKVTDDEEEEVVVDADACWAMLMNLLHIVSRVDVNNYT